MEFSQKKFGISVDNGRNPLILRDMRKAKKMGFGKRLLEIEEVVAHGNRAEFARMLSRPGHDISPNTLINWYEETHVPRADVALRAARLYGKSLDWLMTGQDPPQPRTFGTILDKQALAAGITLDPDMLEKFHALPQIIAAVIEIAEAKNDRKTEEYRAKAQR